MTTDVETDLERRVLPLGKLLNDNDTGVDQLGYLVYAQALAKLLHSCRPPLTVGIFGPWGIGKTFLLKHVQGLLRKYELQERYDAEEEIKAVGGISRNKSFATNFEPTDTTSVSIERANKKPRNRTHKTNVRRACVCFSCTILCLFVVAALCTLLIMVIIPSLRPYSTPPAFPDLDTIETITNRRIPSGRSGVMLGNGTAFLSSPRPSGRRLSYSEFTSSTTVPTTTESTISPTTDDDEKTTIQGNLRLYLVLVSVIFTGMVFVVFCCCVANTNSKCWPRFMKHYSLIFYAAFTRLPSVAVSPDSDWMEANNPYMVVNMNDEKARLKYLNQDDDENIEGIKLSSDEISSMPVRYIFVNYHAWQYAGSDVLWAGIVTNLAQAIENEFGAVCTRLFRMMQVERPSKSGPIKASLWKKEDPRAIYVNFKFAENLEFDVGQKHDRILLLMKEYGVVTQCCIYRDDWWYVRFSNDKEANFALKALQLDNFDVQKQRPKRCHRRRDIASDDANSAHDRDEAQANERLVVHNSSENNCGQDVRQDCIPLQNLAQNRSSRSNNVVEEDFRTDQSRKTTDDEKESPGCCSSPSCCRSFSHFRKHPKTVCCGCPFLYCCIVFVFAAIIFPITVLIVANTLELNVLKSTRAIPVEVQIFSWLPAVVGVMVVAFRFCWAMCNSQTERIRKALSGTEGTMGTALGFMNDVKTEVMLMTQLINCIRFTHRINYRIVITIDDLDRCPNDKVKSVLEAVSILLSDKSSPFLCLVAVDSRVAVKCIEQDMGEVMLKANLTGHEYLKKIINLPFCLPEVANNAKRKYFGGIMDMADETKVGRFPKPDDENRAETSRKDSNRHPVGKGDQLDSVGFKTKSRSTVTGIDGIPKSVDKAVIDAESDDHSSASESDEGEEINTTSVDGGGKARPSQPDQEHDDNLDEDNLFSNFLFKCRQALESDEYDEHGGTTTSGFIRQHMCGNPRNMKRIFNVLSLTTHLMKCMQERSTRRQYVAMHSKNCEPFRYRSDRRTSIFNSNLMAEANVLLFKWTRADAEDLVRWIVLTDQWPYRVSYILQVIDDSDQRRMAKMTKRKIGLDTKLSYIYENYVEPEIDERGNVPMLTLDEDPALLRSFLRGSPSLTRRRVTSLFPVTLNLDQSIRSGISRLRSTPPDRNQTSEDQA